MHWFILTIISAICLAAADALTKKFLPDYKGEELLVIRFCVPALLLLPMTWAYPIGSVPVTFHGLMFVLVPLELSATWLYMVAIRDSPLYLTLPYLAFTPVFNVLTGYIVLGELVSIAGFAGIILVVLGTYILNLDPSNKSNWFMPFVAIVKERGSRLMLIAAGIYSITSVLSKKAMGYTTPEAFGPFYFVAIGLVLFLLLGITRPVSLKVLGKRPRVNLIIGVLISVMVITHFLAIADIEVAYMIAVKRSSLLFGILFGALLFKEQHAFRHFVAGVLMVIGVTIILLPD